MLHPRQAAPRLLRTLGVCALFIAPAFAADAPWPTKPIRMIVAVPPGGPADTLSRLVSPKLTEALGRPVIIDNRPGANGNIAYEMTARATPDGHTFTAVAAGVVINPSLYPGVAYDPLKDFAPITLGITSLKRSAVAPELPTVAESGLPGFEVIGWFGWLAPVATPRPIVTRLHAELVSALRLPEVRERLLSQSTEPVGNTPQEFAAFMKSEHAKWAKVIKAAKVRIE